jgi:hypothetical protein
MNDLLPEGAWDQGFTSRTLFIFSEKPSVLGDIFYTDEADMQLHKEINEDLIIDLKSITHLFGQVIWTPEAKATIQKWVAGGEQPVPEHGRLTHYNTRRQSHMLKLSTIASVSRTNAMVVLPEDFDTALAWLVEAENAMPDIFRSMATTVESRSMEDARFHIAQLFKKLNGPVPERYVVDFLKHRAQPQNIMKMIEIMEKSGMVKKIFGKDGTTYYRP